MHADAHHRGRVVPCLALQVTQPDADTFLIHAGDDQVKVQFYSADVVRISSALPLCSPGPLSHAVHGLLAWCPHASRAHCDRCTTCAHPTHANTAVPKHKA